MKKFLDVQRTTMLTHFSTGGSAASPVGAPVAVNSADPIVSPEPLPGTIETAPLRHEAHQGHPAAPSTNGHVVSEPIAETKPIVSRGTETNRSPAWPNGCSKSYGIGRVILKKCSAWSSTSKRTSGIDSIKRIEILGSLRDTLPTLNGSESELMDQLSRARTLGAIIERVNSHLDQHAPKAIKPGSHASKTSVKASRNGHHGVRRMILEAKDAPLPTGFQERALVPGGLVLLTDDGRGVARAASESLRDRGFKTLIVGTAGSRTSDVVSIDLTSPAAVSKLAERARSGGSGYGV